MPEFILILKSNWLGILLVLIAIMLLIVVLKAYGAAISSFIREVKLELAKASWPWDPKEKGFKRYKELWDSTLVVVIAMLLMSGYVAFWDFILVSVVGAMTGAPGK